MQLCTTAAVASAMRGDQVMYIDTTGSFSSRRAANIHSTLHSRLQVLHIACAPCSIPCLCHTCTHSLRLERGMLLLGGCVLGMTSVYPVRTLMQIHSCIMLVPLRMHACMQDNRTLTDVLQNIHVNLVHTAHEALAVLDALALTMQVFSPSGAVLC